MANGLAAQEARAAAGSRERKTRVFISYSRKDSAFADRLVEALNARDFDAYLDKKDILPGEPWKERLGALILSADAVVFVISPDSTASEICGWEIDETERLQKKLLPVLHRPLADNLVPPRLGRLNYIFLSADDDFEAGLATLAAAIDTDIGWIRQHTRISELARRWEEGKRRDQGLLRGEDIAEAERWRDSHPKAAPAATATQLAYLTASRQAATRRQRYAVGGSVAVAAVAIALAGFAYWQRDLAVKNEARAVANETLAKMNEERATKERDQALTTQSLFLADLAQQKVAAGDEVTAMLLSLEALPGGGAQGDRPYVPEAERSLYAARFGRRAGLQEIAVLRGHTERITTSAFSPDGTRIVTASLDKTARLWDATAGAEIAILAGHAAEVDGAAFSRDGARIMTRARDESVRIWDGKTGGLLAVLKQERSVDQAFFAADGRRVITASGAGVQLWDVETGKTVAALAPEEAGRFWRPAATSPDGLRVLADAGGTTARLLETKTGSEIATLVGHQAAVRSVGFSPDGARLVTTSLDGTARTWDGRTGASLATFKHEDRRTGSRSPVNLKAVLNAEGTRVVTYDSGALLWDGRTRRKIVALAGHANTVNEVAFNSDGTRLFTKSVDAVRLWDAKTGSEIAPLAGHGDLLQEAHFSHDGKQLITTSDDKTARLWDAATGAQIAVLGGHENTVWDAAFSRDGKRIITQSEMTLRLWSAPSTSDVVVLKGHNSEVSSAAFSLDGKRIVTASADGTARVWDGATGAALSVLKGHKAGVTSAAFSLDGSRVVTASQDATVRVWDTRGVEIASLNPRQPGDWKDLEIAAFSPDGRRVLASVWGSTRVWDVETKQEVLVLPGGDGAFTPEGAHIMTVTENSVVRFFAAADGKETDALDSSESPISATLSRDGTKLVTTAGFETGDARAIVWDLKTKTRLAMAKSDNRMPFNSTAFSPDGVRLVTANDRTARIWDAGTGAAIAVLAEHDGKVTSASFSPDGTRLLTASADRTARVSPVFVNTSTVLLQSKQDVTRCLTADERRQFFLPEDPPPWCIEMDKWPYSTAEWKTWLAGRMTGNPQPRAASAN